MIPKTNLINSTIPVLGLGTYKMQGKECFNSVKKAIDLGYTHIDTAEYYENELQIGNAIKKSNKKRKNLFITSKVWFNHLNPIDLFNSFNESISKLQTNYLDLYLIHWPQKEMDLIPAFNAFKELQEKNKIKSIGVSNFTINHLKDALPQAKKAGLKIELNQVEFHPGLFQKELLEFCESNNIKLTAYSPLGRGELLNEPILKEIALNHEKTTAQICLKWILSKKIIVIPKTVNENRLKENMNLFDFKLTKKEINEIDKMGNNQRFIVPDFAEFDY